MRLAVLALMLAAASVGASVQAQRTACRGVNCRRYPGYLCTRRGGTYFPRGLSGCPGRATCVKFLGLGESCAEHKNSSRALPQPVCGKRLQCDPETKRCVAVPTIASNSTEASMKMTPRCGRWRPYIRCSCRRFRRHRKRLEHSSWRNFPPNT